MAFYEKRKKKSFSFRIARSRLMDCMVSLTTVGDEIVLAHFDNFSPIISHRFRSQFERKMKKIGNGSGE